MHRPCAERFVRVGEGTEANVYNETNAQATRKTKNLPPSYRNLLATELLNSGMDDPQQWANIALHSTMSKLETKAASHLQKGLRGWAVRNRLSKEKERKRMQVCQSGVEVGVGVGVGVSVEVEVECDRPIFSQF